MTHSDDELRAQAFEAYDAIPSLEEHGELVRLILAEVSLLTEKYRCVRRHDIPHIRELIGLVDVLWQEIEMRSSDAATRAPVAEMPSLPASAVAAEPAPEPEPHKPVFHEADFER